MVGWFVNVGALGGAVLADADGVVLCPLGAAIDPCPRAATAQCQTAKKTKPPGTARRIEERFELSLAPNIGVTSRKPGRRCHGINRFLPDGSLWRP